MMIFVRPRFDEGTHGCATRLALARAIVVACLLLGAAAAPARASQQTSNGVDFADDLRRVHAAVTCGAPLDATDATWVPDATVVRAHCQHMDRAIDTFTSAWKTRVVPTLDALVPRDAARAVVYPFGGGDLLTALGVFSEAREITTLSLEPAGDIRAFRMLAPDALARGLARVRETVDRLLVVRHSKTENLSALVRGGLPGELVFALVALRVNGFEPVALRYFDVDPDGTLAYVDQDALARFDAHARARDARKLFANAELEFRRPGTNERRVFRHIAVNLADDHLATDDRVLTHLRGKGRVFAMTKAASYLLWWETFSRIRAYVAENADFLIADSTGLPPDVARQHGFRLTTFGSFDGPFLPGASSAVARQCIDLWASQPKRPLPFRFGYPDSAGHNHLVVMSKLPGGDAPAPP